MYRKTGESYAAYTGLDDGTRSGYHPMYVLNILQGSCVISFPTLTLSTCTVGRPSRRGSNGTEDLEDIATLLEAHPCTDGSNIRDPAPETLLWVRTHPAYEDWMSKGDEILWVHGEPGKRYWASTSLLG